MEGEADPVAPLQSPYHGGELFLDLMATETY